VRSDILFPAPEVLLEQCGKLQMLDRLLKELQARKHKVLIFSQVRAAGGGEAGAGQEAGMSLTSPIAHPIDQMRIFKSNIVLMTM